MNKKQFLVFETIKTAWRFTGGVKTTFWAVMGLLILIAVVNGVLNKIMHQAVEPFFIFSAFVMHTILSVIYTLLSWGLIWLGIQRSDGELIRFDMVKQVFRWKLFCRMVGLFLLDVVVFLPIAVMVAVWMATGSETLSKSHIPPVPFWLLLAGLGWLVVAVWMMMRLFVTAAILIAEDAPFWKAVKKSFRVTHSHVLQLFGLHILNVLILFVGLATLGVGLIWIIPYVLINYGVVYRRLAF